MNFRICQLFLYWNVDDIMKVSRTGMRTTFAAVLKRRWASEFFVTLPKILPPGRSVCFRPIVVVLVLIFATPPTFPYFHPFPYLPHQSHSVRTFYPATSRLAHLPSFTPPMWSQYALPTSWLTHLPEFNFSNISSAYELAEHKWEKSCENKLDVPSSGLFDYLITDRKFYHTVHNQALFDFYEEFNFLNSMYHRAIQSPLRGVETRRTLCEWPKSPLARSAINISVSWLGWKRRFHCQIARLHSTDWWGRIQRPVFEPLDTKFPGRI